MLGLNGCDGSMNYWAWTNHFTDNTTNIPLGGISCKHGAVGGPFQQAVGVTPPV
ncbi:hypothetical protein ACVWZ8_004048 [Arthrobacter sp. UYCu723]